MPGKKIVMIISAEISYYPLKDKYLMPIQQFIDNLGAYNELFVRPNGMSTHVVGDYEQVFVALTTEIKKAFEVPDSVFVIKLLNTDMRGIE